MAYGREQLRRAGEALLNLDERYAKAVVPEGMNEAPMAYATRGIPVRDMINVQNNSSDNLSLGEKLYGTAIQVGVPVSNIAARYALPAGGITLAGKGLIDLTGMLVSPEEQTVGTVMP